MSIQDLLINGLDQIQTYVNLHGAFQHILTYILGWEFGLQPDIDVLDTETNLYVYIELPGVTESSIKVDFYNKKVSISGEKLKRYTEVPLKKEIVYGKFHRNIILPIGITKQENVSASYKNGVLLLTIDKQREEQNRFRMGVNNLVKTDINHGSVD